MPSLTKKDLQNILEAPLKAKQERIVQLRDKIILELLYSAGVKVAELVSLQLSDFDLEKQQIKIKGRQGKTRALAVSNQTKYWLTKYLTERRTIAQNLFNCYDKAKNSRQLKNLTARSVQRLIKKYSKQAGLSQKITPHSFRRNFASELFDQGEEIKKIKEKMGHVSINTTKLYTKRNQMID